MDVMGVVTVGLVVGITGLIIGLLLGFIGMKFKVEVDQKEIDVRECLPGNNCGACGYAGCDAMAKAIANGAAPVNGCPVGGADVAAKIAAIMGVEAGSADKKAAYVKCSGTCDKVVRNFDYYGLQDCRTAAVTPGKGGKKCSFGCIGLGSCIKECDFDAISIVGGVANIDRDKCAGCGKCAKVCPNALIELFTVKASYAVQCSSKDKGKAVKEGCDVGCIACKACVKVCESDAISVENNIAHIDQEKCIGCGKCAEKCPQKIIHVPNDGLKVAE
ncbi:electron transport complex, RnfABCDGE type, B subunit [Acetitomaculum ruminis DSM 5522]|uniref:Ion-translocating oxidoreductase complex subunit B n=1 Tax=Acetitomaculum ruminis DSM 5522 TaxID=1120918 RepID=A0A1I1A4V6_9FIRM|nr:RnfABCDGE type electron transport complex subunit B [Acetitomaculum ruminis]SFB32989.1 electron transport complex, RnfABCDGE type, B subunit [Acetitomaculum ruminis DSM 5522]